MPSGPSKPSSRTKNGGLNPSAGLICLLASVRPAIQAVTVCLNPSAGLICLLAYASARLPCGYPGLNPSAGLICLLARSIGVTIHNCVFKSLGWVDMPSGPQIFSSLDLSCWFKSLGWVDMPSGSSYDPLRFRIGCCLNPSAGLICLLAVLFAGGVPKEPV